MQFKAKLFIPAKAKINLLTQIINLLKFLTKKYSNWIFQVIPENRIVFQTSVQALTVKTMIKEFTTLTTITSGRLIYIYIWICVKLMLKVLYKSN